MARRHELKAWSRQARAKVRRNRSDSHPSFATSRILRAIPVEVFANPWPARAERPIKGLAAGKIGESADSPRRATSQKHVS